MEKKSTSKWIKYKCEAINKQRKGKMTANKRVTQAIQNTSMT